MIPASFNSAKDRSVWKAIFGSPILRAHRHASDADVDVGFRISDLDGLYRPSAIAGLVIAPRVYSVYGVEWAWLGAHVFKPSLIAISTTPFVGDFNASTAIKFVRTVGFAIASAYHGFPRTLLRTWLPSIDVFASSQSQSFSNLPHKAAATRGMFSSQVFVADFLGLAAIARAEPPGARPTIRSSNHSQASEFLTSKVDEFWHYIMQSFFCWQRNKFHA